MQLASRSHPAPSSSSSAAPPVSLQHSPRSGYITVRSMLDPGSGAQPPTVLHPSSSATPPTLLMPDQPRTAIIMVCQTGVDDGRGLSAACTARELNELSGLPPFNWSPSVASAERHRCALPCGKASTGCRASLRTSCWTRSVRDRLRCARSNAETASGFQTMCPLHWSRPVTRAGRDRRVLQRRSDLDGCAALLRMSPSALPLR